jgi:hypothetical protein
MPSGTINQPHCNRLIGVAKATIAALVTPAALLLAFLGLGGDIGASSALAMDVVTLRRGDLGKEREFLSKYVRDARAGNEDDRRPDYPRRKDLYVGRYDLNGDGQYELFLFQDPPWDTGTAPRFAVIYQKIADNWTAIGDVPPIGRGRTCTIEVSEERFHGWRTVLGDEYGLMFGAWTEEHIRLARLMRMPIVEHSYVGICFTDRCAWEQEESYWGPLVERPMR